MNSLNPYAASSNGAPGFLANIQRRFQTPPQAPVGAYRPVDTPVQNWLSTIGKPMGKNPMVSQPMQPPVKAPGVPMGSMGMARGWMNAMKAPTSQPSGLGNLNPYAPSYGGQLYQR